MPNYRLFTLHENGNKVLINLDAIASVEEWSGLTSSIVLNTVGGKSFTVEGQIDDISDYLLRVAENPQRETKPFMARENA